MDGSHDSRGHGGRRAGRRRRRTSAGAALLALLLGFALAGLLDARALERDARGMPVGPLRSLCLALLRPAVALNQALGLDRPAAVVREALSPGPAAPATAPPRPPRPLWPRRVTRERPLRLYIAGDSMAQVFGSSLVNLAEGTGLVRARLDYHVSSGLSRPDFFDWRARFREQLAAFRPDAVVAVFGANDGQDVEYRGEVLHVGTRAWLDLYARRVAAAMRLLSRDGRRVYWVGQPIMRDPGYRERIAMMDRVYREQAARFPGVHFVSSWALFADARGRYAAALPDASGVPVPMRQSDGIHLTREGGDRLAAAVFRVIARDWDLPLD